MSDQAERVRALDPSCSFIVQAPAGSGKTELLTQRYLALLRSVEQPEQVLAITFTRKAAAEMRRRIVSAVQEAAAGGRDVPDHRRRTLELATEVARRDADCGWQLSNNPGRLRVQTIDALHAALANAAPLTNGGLGLLPPQPDATALYGKAAHRLLRHLTDDAESATDLSQLLMHMDNNSAAVQTLIADALARRDQWLARVLSATGQREQLERAMEAVIDNHLGRLRRELAECTPALPALLREAALHAQNPALRQALQGVAESRELPATSAADLPAWRAVAEVVLKASGSVRRRLDRRQGVLPGDHAGRRTAGEVLAQLRDRGPLTARLHQVRQLPAPRFGNNEWRALSSLLRLLPLAAAELRLVFQEAAQVDFLEVALAAQWALRDSEDGPTELGLALDYRIQHILVDEFQDTSHTQFRLLEQLTETWVPGDGRSLFLVGDPMQSIYRFREADLGLFVHAWHHGLGGVALAPLTLKRNFRSSETIVQWVNDTFAALMPAEDDSERGAVRYVPCLSTLERRSGDCLQLHPLAGASADAEGRYVAELVTGLQRAMPGGRVAVLARSRRQLWAPMQALRHAGVSFQAVDLESSAASVGVQDLLTLTRALCHLHDRVAWLALLRAPWCGLSWKDIHLIARAAGDGAVWPTLADDRLPRALPGEGRARVARLREVLGDALAQRGRRRLVEVVRGAWLRLGGAGLLADDESVRRAEGFLDFLAEQEAGGDLDDPVAFEAALQRQSLAQHAPAGDFGVEVMTMHRAKGLEFDAVVVCGLGRRAGRSDPPLLRWTEIAQAQGPDDLLMAPRPARGADDSGLFDWIGGLEQERDRLEEVRLLYVAATRARRVLHLVGNVETRDDDNAAPAGSLWASLWPGVKDALATRDSSFPASDAQEGGRWAQVPLWRLRGAPEVEPDVALTSDGPALTPARDARPEFEWASSPAIHAGAVVHRWLHRVAEDGLDQWNVERVRSLRGTFRAALRARGVAAPQAEPFAARVEQALAAVLRSDTARWILSSRHSEAECEWELETVEAGVLKRVVIDRSFVDADGVRWIIDYKTGFHEGSRLEAFLASEETRYRPQLETYARALRVLEPRRSLKLGLYFPLLDAWRCWSAESE